MKLIDKDAVLAIIEEKLSYYKDLEDREIISDCGIAGYRVIKRLKSDIESLEMKEVDLEEEIESYFKGFGKFASVGIDDCIDIAKYFFELGLKTQKGE